MNWNDIKGITLNAQDVKKVEAFGKVQWQKQETVGYTTAVDENLIQYSETTKSLLGIQLPRGRYTNLRFRNITPLSDITGYMTFTTIGGGLSLETDFELDGVDIVINEINSDGIVAVGTSDDVSKFSYSYSPVSNKSSNFPGTGNRVLGFNSDGSYRVTLQNDSLLWVTFDSYEATSTADIEPLYYSNEAGTVYMTTEDGADLQNVKNGNIIKDFSRIGTLTKI